MTIKGIFIGGGLVRQSSESLNDRVQRISDALYLIKGPDGEHSKYGWAREVFDDYAIVCMYDDTTKLVKIPYAIGLDDTVTFGEPIEVEEKYVPVNAAETTTQQSGITVRQSLDPEGWKWRCQIVEFGISQTRDVWRQEIFSQSLPSWEGIGCFIDHPTESEMRELPERSIEKKVGWWSDFAITGQGVDATLNIKPSASWLKDDLKSAYDEGCRDFYGFSILVRSQARQVKWSDGKPAIEHARILKPLSIDCVTTAAAGGKVKYALASVRARDNDDEGDQNRMKKMLLAFFKADESRFKLVRQSLVSAGADGVTESMTVEQLTEHIGGDETLVEQALAVTVATGVLNDPPPPAATRTSQSEEEIPFGRLPKELREGMVAQAYRDSQLPEGIQLTLRKKLGANATLEDTQRTIEVTREAMAIVTSQGLVDNPGRIRMGAEAGDKFHIGLAKAFGLTREDFAIESRNPVRQSLGAFVQPAEGDWNSVPKVLSLKRLYIEMTGDEGLTGEVRRDSRVTRQADWQTGSFVETLANFTGKRLLKDYREVNSGWDRVVTTKSVSDFKAQRAILLGYLADLASVSQDAAYADAAVLTDTEETYSVSKRGVVVPLTLETVANDDLNGFARIIGRLGRTAARTLAKFVWNTLIMANPTMNADALALFHATHNNLITDALSTTGLKNAITKLLSQTEPGSSEAMVLSTMSLTLAVPPGIYLDAVAQTDFNQEPQGNIDPLAREIRRLGITPVNVPFFTDANDWLLAASPADIDMVEVAFWNGNEEPEFFTQADPTQGASFSNDVIAKYKVRHIYGGVPVDFRGMVKSVVL